MSFNHYTRIKRILAAHASPWYVRRIDLPTKALSFKGELRTFDHYYRIYDQFDQPIKYCKFQQLDRFLSVMNLSDVEVDIRSDEDFRS